MNVRTEIGRGCDPYPITRDGGREPGIGIRNAARTMPGRSDGHARPVHPAHRRSPVPRSAAAESRVDPVLGASADIVKPDVSALLAMISAWNANVDEVSNNFIRVFAKASGAGEAGKSAAGEFERLLGDAFSRRSSEVQLPALSPHSESRHQMELEPSNALSVWRLYINRLHGELASGKFDAVAAGERRIFADELSDIAALLKKPREPKQPQSQVRK